MKKLLFVALALALLIPTAVAFAGHTTTPKLNLSHVACVDGEVEIHFVLLDYSGTPGSTLFFGNLPFGSAPRGAHNGNVWHYTVHYASPLYVNLSWATVSGVWAGSSINDYNGWYRCGQEEPTATPTNTATPTPTDTGTPTPTDQPTATPTSTDEPTATPTATPKPCVSERFGWLFHLVGAEGQTCDLASYEINPNTGRYAIPNVEAQQICCGFVAVNIPFGREIVVGCDGKVNIVCEKCMGGGPSKAYGH